MYPVKNLTAGSKLRTNFEALKERKKSNALMTVLYRQMTLNNN